MGKQTSPTTKQKPSTCSLHVPRSLHVEFSTVAAQFDLRKNEAAEIVVRAGLQALRANPPATPAA